MKNKTLSGERRGIVLITTVLIMVLLMALASFFMGTMTSEFRIASANKGGIIGFYVAESGAEEAIFKVKNDNTYKTAFVNGTLNASFTRDPYLVANSLYTVSVVSIAPGEAQITSTGKYKTGILTTQRVIKAKIIKGINQNPPWNNAIYAMNGIDIFGSRVDINNGGDMFANDDIRIWGFSNVNAGANVYTNSDINVWPFSTLTVNGEKKAQNFPVAPDAVEMPMIDFDSSNPNSLLNLATNVYTQAQFDDLIKNNSNLTLSGIIYVKGDVTLKKGKSLTITGALVTDGNVNIGMTAPGPAGSSVLTINKPADDSLSGLFTKTQFKMGPHAQNVNINGLVYCNDQSGQDLFNFNSSLTITGGIIARSISIRNISGNPVTINFDSGRIQKALTLENSESPTVQVEHWEESY